ncbi:DUF1428 family protein, partial [Aeromonas caviae]
MSYVDGFVLAVPTANKQALIDHAGQFDPIFLEYGATRVLECLSLDQILIPCAIRSLAARKPSILLC